MRLPRRILVVFALLVTAAIPAVAVSASSDEKATARAQAASYGTAVKEFQTSLRDARRRTVPAVTAFIKRAGSCRRQFAGRGAPAARVAVFEALLNYGILQRAYDEIQPDISTFVGALEEVRTTDGALRRGSQSWARLVTTLTLLPADNPEVCPAMRAWRARSFAAASRPANPALFRRLVREASLGLPRFAAAARRLQALRVPRRIAQRFVPENAFLALTGLRFRRGSFALAP